MFFFSEASLAHETACTLRDLGDLEAAQTEFKRSVRTRALPFARTHAVTLGYLGDVQVRQGQVEAACATWTKALDGIDGIQSGRVRDTVVQMSHALSPYGPAAAVRLPSSTSGPGPSCAAYSDCLSNTAAHGAVNRRMRGPGITRGNACPRTSSPCR